jgi:hypothetical protein
MSHLRLVKAEPEPQPDHQVQILMDKVMEVVRAQFGELADGPLGAELRARVWDAVIYDLVLEDQDSEQKR